MEKVIVKSDALGIIDRLKMWNKKYEIYYNLKSKKSGYTYKKKRSYYDRKYQQKTIPR